MCRLAWVYVCLLESTYLIYQCAFSCQSVVVLVSLVWAGPGGPGVAGGPGGPGGAGGAGLWQVLVLLVWAGPCVAGLLLLQPS